MTHPVSQGITIRITQEILASIDRLQPSHLTRKAFVNQLLVEAVQHRDAAAKAFPREAGGNNR